jgi:hypothetical protein
LFISVKNCIASFGIGFTAIATAKERTGHTITPDHEKEDCEAKRPDKYKAKDHSYKPSTFALRIQPCNCVGEPRR